MLTIDILVPSFRVDTGPLFDILNLHVPDGLLVRWIIVVDDPSQQIPDELVARVDDDVVQLIRNSENLGSAGNAGLR